MLYIKKKYDRLQLFVYIFLKHKTYNIIIIPKYKNHITRKNNNIIKQRVSRIYIVKYNTFFLE